MKSHSQALHSFATKLTTLLMVRQAVRWTTAWFFIWGVIVLAVRFSGVHFADWLLYGLLFAVPLAAIAALRENRKRVAFAQVRAAYDGLNRCGGVVMAEEAAEMAAWQATLPQPTSPVLRWRGGRTLGLLTVATLFVGTSLLLPDRFTALAVQKPLEIGKLVSELNAEVETLKEEKILEEEKAEDLQKQLTQLKEQSSAVDPAKTWEALDHIKESNADMARQAAEEALSKTTALTEAETLASALQQANESGMGEDRATRAEQDLAGMLKSAKLEEGLLKGDIPPELLSQLEGLKKEDLEKLLGAIQFNKNSLGKTLTNLANLKLIDAKKLSECKNAGKCPNPDALAAFLCNSTNQCDSFSMLAISYCRGGISRGRGDAPMTWKEETSDQGAKFKEESLPAATRLSDSRFVGVSRSAPELSGDSVVAEQGALAQTASGGGSSHSQVVLPRHKQTVQRFFKREE
jgi:hypothetical protein